MCFDKHFDTRQIVLLGIYFIYNILQYFIFMKMCGLILHDSFLKNKAVEDFNDHTEPTSFIDDKPSFDHESGDLQE